MTGGPAGGIRRRPRGDDGSALPLILLCFLLGLLVVAGTVTASSAFLAQRDLQSDCDAAAVVAAAAVDSPDLYTGDVLPADLPVAADAARAAVEEYAGRSGLRSTQFAVTVPGRAEVDVVCHRTVAVPFGAMVGLGDGVPRTARSGARSPVRP